MIRTITFPSIVRGAVLMMAIRLMLDLWWPTAGLYYPNATEIFWYIGGALAYWLTGKRVDC